MLPVCLAASSCITALGVTWRFTEDPHHSSSGRFLTQRLYSLAIAVTGNQLLPVPSHSCFVPCNHGAQQATVLAAGLGQSHDRLSLADSALHTTHSVLMCRHCLKGRQDQHVKTHAAHSSATEKGPQSASISA